MGKKINSKTRADYNIEQGPYKNIQEVYANFVGDMLFEKGNRTLDDLISGIDQKERSRFIQALLDIIDWLKQKFKGNKEITFGLVRLETKYKRALRAAQKAWDQKTADNKKATSEGGESYSIRKDIVDVNGKEYETVVELDKPISKRTLSEPKRFFNYIKSNLLGLQIPVEDAFGNLEVIEFAAEDDTTTKNGKSHPVLGELKYIKGDIRRLVVANFKEVTEESSYDPEFSTENSEHGWLDKNGWESRKTYVLQDGVIYEAYLKIAKASDGRNILYSVNLDINNGIAVDKDATNKRAAVLAAMPSSVRISQNGKIVKQNLSPDSEGVTENADGEPVAHSVGDGTVQFSISTYETDGRSQLREYLEKCVSSDRLTQAEMDEMLDGIEEIYEVCKAAQKAWEQKTADNKKASKSEEYINFSLMNDKSFAENVDDILAINDADAKRNAEEGNFVRIMSDTPSIILDNVIGAENHEVIVSFYALYLAIRNNGALEGHYHNLGDLIKNLPEYISNPQAIVRMDNGRVNLFNQIKTERGNNGILSIELNTVKDINNKNDKYNLVITVYSANDNHTKNNIENRGVKVEYVKEDLSQVNPQLHKWLATINERSSNHSIPTSPENVKEKLSRDSEGVTENADGEPVAHSVGDGTVQFSISTYETEGRSELRQYPEKSVSSNKFADYDKPITLDDIKILRDIGRKSINDFSTEEVEIAQKWAYKFYQQLGIKSPFFRRWFGDWRAYESSASVDILVMEHREGKNPRGTYKNRDTGWVINSSSVGYDETISHSGKDKKSIIAMRNIDKIIENAVLFDTEVSEYGRGKKSIYTAFMHKFYAPISIDGKRYIVKMAVDESHAPGQNDSNKKFYHVRAIEIETASSVGIGKSHTPIIEDTVSAISISDLFNLVKQYDSEFKPKPVNEVLIDNGKPKVFYHGTNAEFTEFDKRKSKPGFYGRGFYFTTEKSQAHVYGNEMEVYLNIKNPLMPDGIEEIYEVCKAAQKAWEQKTEDNKKATSEGGESYSLSLDVDRYTEKQYNAFGWVRYNDVLSSGEYETLLSRYADYKHNKDYYPTTRFGEAVIHSSEYPDVIMYVKGPIKSPQITKVIKFNTDNDWILSELREELLTNERARNNFPLQAIESFYGKEIFSISKARDYASFQEYKSTTKGSGRKTSNTAGGVEQNRTRSTKQNTETDRADLNKSAFSMPEDVVEQAETDLEADFSYSIPTEEGTDYTAEMDAMDRNMRLIENTLQPLLLQGICLY